MLKIVKSQVYNFDSSRLVSVGEPAVKKKAESETGDEAYEPTPEEIAERKEQQRRKHLEEEAKRFSEAVIKRSDEIVAVRQKKVEAEYERMMASANTAAEQIMKETREKAAEIIEEARDDGKRLREQARIEGFETGFETGRSEALKKCEKYLDTASMLLSEINSRKEAYYISHEYELCQTVLEMVKKITLSELKTDPEVIDRIAANAAKSFRNSDYVKISLAEGEASREFVTDKEFIRSLIPFIPEIEIEELDPRDAPAGTVVIDNGSEIIDASIPTQLDFLREIMRGSHNNEDNGAEEDNT